MNEPIVNGEGLTYYEWICAAGARGRCSDQFLRQWAAGVDPAEIKAEFLRELGRARTTREQNNADASFNANRSPT